MYPSYNLQRTTKYIYERPKLPTSPGSVSSWSRWFAIRLINNPYLTKSYPDFAESMT